MKRLFLFILPTWIWAQSYPEVISVLDHSLMLQSAQQLEIAAYESYKAAEGKNLPTLDASLSAIKFQDTTTVTFGSMKLPMGTKNHTEGSLTLTYPLFSGFAISSSIEKAKFSHEKAALEVADLKRNLYVNATKLYSAVAVADEIIAAQEEAKYAIGESYAKAKGLYDNGMLAPAELYAIEAKKFEIDAQITESKNRKSQALNQLSYLTGVKIDSAHIPENTLSIPDENDILARALAEREDVLALSKSMDIAQSDVKISQSRYYPTVALIGSLKGQGDSLEFDGDGYTNGNKSYAGVSASWNLFSGFSDIHTTEAAKAAKLASSITLEDYKHRISTEIENAYLDMHATQSKLESARMQVKASGEYAKLTRGRFENQLVGADELSRSIADLASAKAKAANLESELFNQTAVLWLEGGLNAFQERVIGTFRNTP
ncbi:TolC family protein [Sulfuricurvum sp.]|uniref:TolC family protein n=1 Tax=Sulfuricurvum sp. TaxID=2025608 RepID=UPI002D3B8765|nr:TolC family protein [Sulfuricurvum sp.]HZF70187.1 TolC family protein [Sulfuricurvum sp.]